MDIAKNSKTPAQRWLVDASIYIFRAYFSLPPHWQSPDGYDTEAVYGFTAFLLDLLAAKPSHVAVCFDESLETGFRHRLYPGYKASRALPDEALAFQLSACAEMAKALGLACFASEDYEADDLLGCLMAQCHEQDDAVAILTRDKDLGQLLVREQDYLWDYAANKRYYAGDIHAKFGVWPHQLVDYLALVGDSADDIPGLPGVGPKTAAGLLAEGELATWLANPQAVRELNLRSAKSLADKLVDYKEQIQLSQQLARIVTHRPLVSELAALKPKAIDEREARACLDAFGLGRLARKLGKVVSQQEQ